jgi:HNH endonuclease
LNKKKLTYEYINELFTYDNGELLWKVRPIHHFSTEGQWGRWNDRFSGKKAGGPNVQKRESRHVITIDDVRYYRSIVVWCLHNKEWPLLTIDHINRNSLDDRIENLRLATLKQQNANKKKSIRNKVGFKGVRTSGKYKWRYIISVDGKREQVAGFNTAEEANAAYLKRMTEMHGEFACGG